MTADEPPEPRNPAGRLTTRAWFQAVLGAMILVVVLGAVLGGRVISTTARASDQLLDRSLPAQREALRFQSALLDQETGVRGFVITGQPQFLDPYNQGVTAEHDAAQQLRSLVTGDQQSTTDLDDIETAVQRWRTAYVLPLIASPAVARAQGDTDAVQGKRDFDGIRELFAQQNRHLADEVTTDSTQLHRSRSVRDGILLGLLAIYLATGFILLVLVRRLVVRPLADLTDASRRVSDGDFTFHIDVHGPADVAAVATAVEEMRRRIVAELDSSRVQETRLQEQQTFLHAQAAELRRSNAELEQFAYVASHDLQEPLRKVASFCQLLEKRYGDKLDDRATQYIAYAVDGAKRMQVLINDLLSFSRVGRMTDDTVPIDLAQPLDRALANLATAIDDSGAHVERPDELPRIEGVPVLLTMLWQNLIGNAIKFRAGDRPPEIRITCEPAEPGWQFTVEDNGIGIEPQFTDKVFVIFQRLHNRDEYGGTGIGLAMAKKIVEHHGGRIWIDTEYTTGTRICFTLVGSTPAPEIRTALTDHDSEGPRP
ncbi:sensor histidine kinase [Nocardia sp. alder85J]|uniref:sensor histidine kinase n=1 Tax=Nocardia sp. alder85J TaxID=2862949 RepID=UPI001CD3D7E8|nr:CHASE3 domain-containing protein [Nocardia sp. alder85J]MCX4095254.1 CHASE3 domain-containing protein [Nocardia sp. alder85J]